MMKKICQSKLFMFVCVFAAIFSFVVAELFAFSSAEAASADHPAVLLRISTYDNSRHLNISGYDDKSAVVASELKNSQNENWRFDYVGTDSKGVREGEKWGYLLNGNGKGSERRETAGADRDPQADRYEPEGIRAGI